MANDSSSGEGCGFFITIIIAIFAIYSTFNKCNKSSESTETTDTVVQENQQPIDFGAIGKEKRTCPKCGFVYDTFDVMQMCLKKYGMCESCYAKEHPSNSSGGGNQYGDGYEQGYEDGKEGNDYDDSGGNGQYRKGYEEGYEEGESERPSEDE